MVNELTPPIVHEVVESIRHEVQACARRVKNEAKLFSLAVPLE